MAEKKWDIYDYVDERGTNLIAEWMQGLQKKDRARLQAKIDLIHSNGPDLPSNLLCDTTSRNIKKIRITGSVALRPMLCRGPINMDLEYTLLCGAFEKDWKLDPANAIELAEKRRQNVINEPEKRRIKRGY